MPLTQSVDPRVERILTNLVTVRGLSYVDAVKECERRAELVAAPYHAAAALLRDELTGNQEATS